MAMDVNLLPVSLQSSLGRVGEGKRVGRGGQEIGTILSIFSNMSVVMLSC